MDMKPMYTGSEWNIDLIDTMWKTIDKIATETFGLDYYEPQIEIISSEQMLDCYSSVAMPQMYSHWSFGKTFLQNERQYRKGMQGLAYEVVINTNPCLTYLMENNTATLQCLVLAHAAVGHSSFFKTNYLFKNWTDADSILDYLKYAKNYIKKCEEKYGENRVEKLLDACHALQNHGIDKYKKPSPLKGELAYQREKQWEQYFESSFNDLWRTIPKKPEEFNSPFAQEPMEPEENLLYFIEKNSPILEPWKKEIVRIVRKISQYFYPQRQTQLCVDGDTEFLTNKGWKKISEYVEGDYVAVYEEGKIRFEQPRKYIENGPSEFIHFKNTRNDQVVTLDHNLVLEYNGEERKVAAKDAVELPKNYWKTINTFSYNSEGLGMEENLLRLHVAYKADGHCATNAEGRHNVNSKAIHRFGFKKQRKIDRLKYLLDATGIKYTTAIYNDVYTIYTHIPNATKKFDWSYDSVSKSDAEIIFDEVFKWDGNEKTLRYSSIYKPDSDFIQYVGSLVGYRGTVTEEINSGFNPGALIYRVGFNTQVTTRLGESVEHEYNGQKSYCFTTSTGKWVSRRSGKISITGNCNEGYATFVHHMLMTELHEQGHIDEGAYLEFLVSHSGVIAQRDWDSKHYSGINVYALGFAMFTDIKRMCQNPDDEDRRWCPDICGTDWLQTIKDIVANYRDESFILQFLSPKVARHFKMFSVHIKEKAGHLVVNGTHDDESFLQIRNALAEQYDLSRSVPHIEVVHVDWKGDRWIYLEHTTKNNQRLNYNDMKKTCHYINKLWGFPVKMEYKDLEGNQINEI